MFQAITLSQPNYSYGCFVVGVVVVVGLLKSSVSSKNEPLFKWIYLLD